MHCANNTPDWIWALIVVWTGVCVHAAHAKNYSSFWLGFDHLVTLRFFYARKQCRQESDDLSRLKAMFRQGKKMRIRFE